LLVEWSASKRALFLQPACASASEEAQNTASGSCATVVSAQVNLNRAAAERKQITVLFADVVGSMELAARVDPERLREIMHELFNQSARVVQRYQGTVDKITGAGLMALSAYV